MGDPVREAREELQRVGLRGVVHRDDVVPDLVLRSWRRSISSSVDGVAPVERYHDVDTDTILCRAAEPVLDRWQHQLADTGTTLFLGDRAGSIVARRVSDSSVRRRLDRAHAAEGFDYSEESVGTNGLGTSMVERRAVMIQGSEHYHEALSRLACAAAPVSAPSGAVLGSISLSAQSESANPLMLSLTREIGQQIEERLRLDARPQDLAMAMSSMRFTNSQRPTVVMDSESLLANTAGLPYVDVTSHVLLWEMLTTHDWRRAATARFHLEDRAVEVVARRVTDGPRDHYVLHFASAAPHPSSSESGVTRATSTPYVASAPPAPWGSSTFLVVAGPPGSGRATTAAALHQRLRPGAALEVVMLAGEVPTARLADLVSAGSDVLLRRAELLTEETERSLRAVVDRQRAETGSASLVVLTTSAERSVLHGSRPDQVHRTVALAETPERVPGLVKAVLDRVDPDGRHTISPAALQALLRHQWPGNLAELVETVEGVVLGVPGSVVERRDLPPHLRLAPPRRQFSLMESAERDAIIRALTAAGGNKSEAASLLGMGRTTLYRRLRHLGLDRDETSL